MHIEFKLPTGAGGQAAAYVNTLLDRELREWCQQHSIQYTKQILHYKVIVTFDRAEAYTLFVLSWHYAKPEFRICD